MGFDFVHVVNFLVCLQREGGGEAVMVLVDLDTNGVMVSMASLDYILKFGNLLQIGQYILCSHAAIFLTLSPASKLLTLL